MSTWDDDRVIVPSPKTEHHEGGAFRVIPMFPELRPFLTESFERAPEGAKYVISGMAYRRGSQTPRGWQNTNLRTTFQKIVIRAGSKPWPRLFHNLRASRETELLDDGYPIQCVTSWIGNSPKIAQRHYLMVTEEHFRRASETPDRGVQKAMHYVQDRGRQRKPSERKKPIFKGF